MTVLSLIMTLIDVLDLDLEHYLYEDEHGNRRKPIVCYELSDEEFTDDKKYPLVMVQPVKIVDDTRGSSCEVEITVGTYGEDNLAFMELCNIVERIRGYLNSNNVIRDSFLRLYPISCDIVKNSPYPFHFAYINATFTISRR